MSQMKRKIWWLILKLRLRYGKIYRVDWRKNGRGILSNKKNRCFYVATITSLEGIVMYLQGQVELLKGEKENERSKES